MALPLFCTAKVPLETINYTLSKSAEQDEINGKPWYRFWVATDDWDSIVNCPGMEACKCPTIPPLPASFVSPYIGKDPIDLMGILKDAPEGSHITTTLFAVIDTQTLQDGSLLLCQVFESSDPEDPEDDESSYPKVVSFRATASISAWTLTVLVVRPLDDEIEDLLESGGILTKYGGRYTKPD